ncbi:MAG TPA: EscU/YscU/HrcU family type III secretion system export apparatus switch protein, partial [Acetobacteraceae bacterium]
VPVSRELPMLASLAAATLILAYVAPGVARDLTVMLRAFLAHADAESLAGAGAFRVATSALVRSVAPFALAAVAAGAGAVLIQTGFLFNAAALRPQAGRISPRAGIRRLLSVTSLAEAAKSLAKLLLLGFAAWHVLSGAMPTVAQLALQDTPALLSCLSQLMLRILLFVLGAQTIVTLADLLWERLHHARQLRMSRQDIRDELRETEGDPKIKARIRQIRMHRARKRMLAAVPRATVVVTNPTHYAVALTYDRGKKAAPRVVAKGVDSMAARIREAAEANSVPLVVNPPLARALYRVSLDTEIPAEHYQAVAEIIAYVWRLDRSVRRRPAA